MNRAKVIGPTARISSAMRRDRPRIALGQRRARLELVDPADAEHERPSRRAPRFGHAAIPSARPSPGPTRL